GLSWMIGLKAYLLIQLMVMGVAGSAGVWLFYVQHQFEGVYWERAEEWDYTAAALQGSSFYKLPKILQWFSGNIGFHHIHHLSPRIPNYYLEKCHRSEPLFQTVKPVTLFASFKSLMFRTSDEQCRELVGHRALKRRQRVTHAAEWLLDKFYLIEEQIQMARRHLPPGYSRELPRLRLGPSAGLPRVYDLVLELISHVDAQVDAEPLRAFVVAYQTVSPLK